MADDRILAIVDDTDPRILYGGSEDAWSKSGSSQEYQSTSHSTSRSSAWAFLAFNGSLVSVYGTLDNTSGSSAYVLDDKDSILTYMPPTKQGFHVPFYTSPLLPYGEHSLNVSLVQDGKTLRLDCFQITTRASDMSQDLAASSAGNMNAAPSPPPSDTQSKPLPPGVIAGIAVALFVILLVAIALLAIIYKMRWHSKHLTPSVEHSSDILGSGECGSGRRSPPGPHDKQRHIEVKILRKSPPLMIPRHTPPVTLSSRSGVQSTAVFSSVISVAPVPSTASIPDANSPYHPREVR